MKRYYMPLAVVLFIAPIAARLLWFYRGIYRPAEAPTIPSYTDIAAPTLPSSDEQTAVEPEQVSGNPIVLIDQTHQNNFGITELEALMRQLRLRGAQIEILSGSDFSGLPLAERLKYADALLIITPTDEYSGYEMSEIETFVEGGGRLVAVADPTRATYGSDRFGFGLDTPNSDVQILNRLLAPFDLRFADAYLYSLTQNEANFRNVVYSRFAANPLTSGLTQLAFYASRPISSIDGIQILRSSPAVSSSLTDRPGEFSPAALSANGDILALGDLSFMTPPYDQVFDNGIFIARIAEFLISGDRSSRISNFPHFFNRPLTILWSETFPANADSVATASNLQESFGVAVHLADEPVENSDVLLFGTFEPNEQISEYLKGITITFPSETDESTLDLPGVGSFEPSGLGVLILNQLEDRLAVVVLADVEENLISLTDLLSSGSLFGCFTTDTLALCKVGETDSSSFDFDFETDFNIVDDFPEAEG
jgi:hypothetical protein